VYPTRCLVGICSTPLPCEQGPEQPNDNDEPPTSSFVYPCSFLPPFVHYKIQ